VFKEHLDTFHTSSGTLTFWNSFSYRLFCMSRFAKTFVKMKSKLSEFGMGCSKCRYWMNPEAIKFHVMAPKISQQRHRHQWCIFLLSFDMCFVIMSPKIAFIFDTYWQVWSCVYNMSWSCWISMTWFRVKKGWKVFMDLHGHHDLAFFKDPLEFQPS
jgi:hypothetical protein